MDRERIHTVCALLGRTGRNHGDWVMIPCPFAKHTHEKGRDERPSFGVSVHNDSESKYNCLACGKKGPISMLPQTLDMMGLADTDTVSTLRRFIADHESFSSDYDGEDTGYLVEMAPMLSEYLLERFRKPLKSQISSRGILPKTAIEFEIRYDLEENRLLFPIRDANGRLVGIRGRFLGMEDISIPKYKEYTNLSPSGRSVKKFGLWYGMNLPLDETKAIILVEGEMDLISLRQVLPKANVLAALGATITKEQLRELPRLSKGVICFFDDDKAGANATNMVAKALTDVPVYRVRVFLGKKDPDDIAKLGRDSLVKSLSSLDRIN